MRLSSFLPVFFLLILSSICIFAQTATPETSTEINTTNQTETASQSKVEVEDETQKNRDILEFGLESEIIELIQKLITDKDESYSDDIYTIFNSTKSVSVREKSIEYFTKMKDTCISDYAVSILEDPYDEKKSTVSLLFSYVSELEIKEACPAVVALFKSENEDYFNNALAALGKVGSDEEAQMLIEYLDNNDMTTAQRQSLMRVLGQLKAVSTWDNLVEIIEDTDENSFVRMYAAEAIGEMEKPESVSILLRLFEDSDPNLRLSALKGLENFDVEESKKTILQAIKDSYYKVRLEAVEASKKLTLKDAVPLLVYRAKNDPENVVKYACYDSIAALDTSDGNDFLISIVKDEKKGDTPRSKAAASLLEYDHAGTSEIIEAAKKTLTDDKKTQLRYAFGKEFAKYKNSKFAEICSDFLASKDVATKGIGLDIYDKNRFITLKDTVQAIADNEKEGVNSKKAKKILASSN